MIGNGHNGGSQKAIAALTVALCVAGSVSAEAGRRGHARNDNIVVAESRFGNGKVSGRVRHTRVGRQVRTPGGNWLHCARSCSETLRVNTVDFWQNEQGAGSRGAIDQEDGLLSRWLRFERRY
jgi:hypothetical protein